MILWRWNSKQEKGGEKHCMDQKMKSTAEVQGN